MVAMFRIIEQGWTKEEAIREMVHGGYRYNLIWFNIIEYVKRVDVEKIRNEVEK
jgi:protein tyrosine/serine phosphatase